ncbi:L-aspartate oxidase [Tyzzerella sp. An114]|uniref:L-aspartate oxidase n=1 Tax=Tyzzerella sp. An114 TaxID=1965545 RepID=UPI000B43C4EA|nr:L-aspartate oxidase [Tyzzerella sp. An114]OUQ56481.1 L-aspartate oxidase [Tyzzerella sp. An114]
MEKADVIIAGTGVAGLFCALNIPENKNVFMITKDAVENNDSFLAQGGISTLKNKDDYDSYFEDTMRAGHYENDKTAVDVMIKSSPDIIKDLIQYNVDFDMEGKNFSYTREGAHSNFRILHHKDITGKEITSKLLEAVKKRKNIHISEYSKMVDIIEENGVCTGIVYKKDGIVHTVKSKVTVLATGGIGGIFESSTNFPHLTADGVAIALKHNIDIKDINYIQIHPTTLYSKEKGRRFLISESVRGEGAYLLNKKGERFVNELLPRDVVSSAILNQMEKDNSDHVYISVTHLDPDFVKSKFPNIYERCLEEGYDMTKEPVPVTPAQHYFMGGIKVNTDSKTSMENLYAAGEVSCNGVHGANRLASNSLLESLVFAKRAVKDFEKYIDDIEISDFQPDTQCYNDDSKTDEEYRKSILNEIKRRDVEFYDKWCKHAG